MTRKIPRKRKSAGLSRKTRRQTGRNTAAGSLQSSILSLLAEQGVPLTTTEIALALRVGSGQLPLLHKTLVLLLEEHKIEKKGKRFLDRKSVV